MSQVAQEGILAFQVPAHYDSQVHQVIFEVSKEPDWSGKMENARNALTKENQTFITIYLDRGQQE